jgi:hypothetical protein
MAKDNPPTTFHLRRRTPGSFLLVPFPRQGRAIRCQSQLEAAAAVILASCPLVAHIQEQPFPIWYRWHGIQGPVEIQLLDAPPVPPLSRQKDSGTSYILPDFLVTLIDGSRQLIEVKPSRRLSNPIVQRKLAVGYLQAVAQAWTFRVVTEQEMFTGPLLANLRLLNRYRQATPEESLIQQLLPRTPVTGTALATLLAGSEPGMQSRLHVQVLHLLATGRLSFDPRCRPLDGQALIFPGGNITWEPFTSAWVPNGCSMDGSSVSSADPLPSNSSPSISSSTLNVSSRNKRSLTFTPRVS